MKHHFLGRAASCGRWLVLKELYKRFLFWRLPLAYFLQVKWSIMCSQIVVLLAWQDKSISGLVCSMLHIFILFILDRSKVDICCFYVTV